MFEKPSTSAALGELSPRPQWVVHNKKKVPCSPIDGKGVGSPPDEIAKGSTIINKDRWSDFPFACERVNANGSFCGVGYVFIENDPYTGIDFDKCFGEKWALDWIKKFDSYTEISPSGNGYHILIRGKKNTAKCKKGGVEVYDKNRYFTFTGNHLKGTPDTINERQSVLDEFLIEIFGQEKEEPGLFNPDETTSTSPPPKSKSSKSKSSKKAKHGELNLDDLDLDDPLDAEMFNALMQNSKEFEKTFNRNRKNLPDTSLSGYDLSLLNQGYAVEWSYSQMAALIRQFRKKHGNEESLTKYYQTVAGEKGYYIKRQIRHVVKSFKGKLNEKEIITEASYNRATDEGNEAIIELLCLNLKFNLEKVIQRGRENASFYFVIDEEEILIGGALDLAKPSVVQARLVESLGKVIPQKTKKEWPYMMELFMEIREIDEEYVPTRERETKILIFDYIAKNPHKEKIDAFAGKDPVFLESGKTWLHANSFVKWINTNKILGNAGIAKSELLKRLQEIGWKPDQRWAPSMEESTKTINKYMWGGKFDETYEESYGQK